MTEGEEELKEMEDYYPPSPQYLPNSPFVDENISAPVLTTDVVPAPETAPQEKPNEEGMDAEDIETDIKYDYLNEN